MYNNIFNQSVVSRSSEENDEEEINSRPTEYENYLDFQVISNYSTNIHHMDSFEQEQILEQNTAGTNLIQSRYTVSCRGLIQLWGLVLVLWQ